MLLKMSSKCSLETSSEPISKTSPERILDMPFFDVRVTQQKAFVSKRLHEMSSFVKNRRSKE